ncbi:hydrogenase [bacterium]|nr:hydrogenase [bacterium]
MKLFFIALGILLLGGLFSAFIKEKFKLITLTLFTAIAMFLLLIPSLQVLFSGGMQGAQLYFSPMFGNINFMLDSLSAFFVTVISVMSFLGLIYANGYIKPYLNRNMNISSHCIFLTLLIVSMLCVVTVQNALAFLIVWEIMSLSSFFLVIFENNKKDVLNAGIKYLVYMHISVIFIISAFAIANIKTGSLDFNDFAIFLNQNQHFANIIFLLAFMGFGTKAGFVPFHNWLPDAHPAAPTHVSGIMSGVMIKTGIYGILRTLCFTGMPSKFIAYTVLITAIISALWGVLYAITQHDIKRLLAYHSIENIGIIGIGIGVGLIGVVYGNPAVAVMGFAGGILHILNHSIFKELLFFAAGSVYIKAHTRNIEMLGGLIKKMPFTAILFIIGSVAICGLPPFNGFISEFLIYAAMIIGLPAPTTAAFMTLVISIAALALIGTMAILCFTKASGVMFLGSPRSEHASNIDSEADKIMIFPMIILAFLCFFIGIFPQYIINIVMQPVEMLLQGSVIPPVVSAVEDMISSISVIFLVFIVLLIAMCILRLLINKRQRQHTTWGCGYDKPNNRMQYTASSYAGLFVSTLKPMFKRISHIKKPKDIFPKEAYYEMEIEDIEEAYIVKPLLKLDEKFLAKFEKIQNGNMQQYILFGLIFLIVAIIGLIYFG